MSETPQSDPNAQHAGNEPPAYQQPAYQQPVYAGYGHPATELSSSDRTWAAASHWGTLVAAWFAMGFLAPLIIMLTVGNQSPFVRRHAVESLNFQISLLIYSSVAVLFSLVTFGLGLLVVLPLALVVLVWVLVVLIQASAKANNGEEYRYPLTLRLVS
jgi:uncharacterized protein